MNKTVFPLTFALAIVAGCSSSGATREESVASTDQALLTTPVIQSVVGGINGTVITPVPGDGAAYYELLRSTTVNGVFTSLGTGVTSLTDIRWIGGQQYYYKLRSYDGSGNTLTSSPVAGTNSNIGFTTNLYVMGGSSNEYRIDHGTGAHLTQATNAQFANAILGNGQTNTNSLAQSRGMNFITNTGYFFNVALDGTLIQHGGQDWVGASHMVYDGTFFAYVAVGSKVYQVDPNTPTSTPYLLYSSTHPIDSLAVGNYLYLINFGNLVQVNTSNGQSKRIGDPNEWQGQVVMTTIGSTIYMVLQDNYFYVINATTGSYTNPGTVGAGFISLAASGSNLYGLTSTGNVYQINTSNGALTFLSQYPGAKVLYGIN